MATSTAAATFRHLYEAHYRSVLAYCLRRTRRSDAHDAAAEVFAIAWRKIDEIPDGDKARTWLYGVAYRVLGHQYRGRRRFERLKSRVAGTRAAVPPEPEAVVVRRAQDEQLVVAAARLSRTDREILMLAGWEELPHADIAELLGISVAAVDQRFHRAKQRLAREYTRIDRPPSSEKGGRA